MAFRMGGSHLLPELISTSFRYTSVENNFIRKVMFHAVFSRCFCSAIDGHLPPL